VLEALAINNEERPPLRIVLANYTTDAHRETAHGLGADHFFDKAMQIGEMLLAVAWLNNTRSDDSHDVTATILCKKGSEKAEKPDKPDKPEDVPGER